MTDSGAALVEARRVFGPTAEVHYGVCQGNTWATASTAFDADESIANEITCWGPSALERLHACLRALPEASP